MAPESQGIPPATTRKNLPEKWIKWIVVALVLGIIVLFVAILFWYKQGLEPRDPQDRQKIHITVKSGDTVGDIARQLEQKGIIKNALALEWYLKLEQSGHGLQAGRYALSPSLSVQKIVTHLEEGKTDLFMITILPGKTLAEIEKSLREYGYSSDEIDKALNANYTHPLLKDRPRGHDLEGYIFPESYEMQSTATLQSLFVRDFDTLYGRLKADGLIDQFKARGLNLHQALTLASIVQKETSLPADQKKVAQVMYKRLGMDMKLETDPTFIYAAEKLGVEPSITVDSPYNTRLHKGLPPGPISNMEYTALQAVARPATTDYLYFVAGDDGTNYFSYTFEEHESNVQKYCHKLCN